MQISSKDFRVREDKKVDLKKWPTRVEPFYKSKAALSKSSSRSTSRTQRKAAAALRPDRYALLLIFQAMDAAGKDGAIKHVMSGVNPQGCQVFSFKQPSAEELDHDFLWRTTPHCPNAAGSASSTAPTTRKC